MGGVSGIMVKTGLVARFFATVVKIIVTNFNEILTTFKKSSTFPQLYSHFKQNKFGRFL